MATNLEFVEYVCDQINGTGAVRYKKMFGEYMVYVNEKPILLVCNDIVYVKILQCLNALCVECDKGIPYKGAKEHYVLAVDNAELLEQIVDILEQVTPLPKPRRKMLHRTEKASRTGMRTLKAYILPMESHIRYMYEGLDAYKEYWDEKQKRRLRGTK